MINSGAHTCILIVGQLQGMTRIMEWVSDEANSAASHVIDKNDEQLAWCEEVEAWMNKYKVEVYDLIQRGHKLPGDLLT